MSAADDGARPVAGAGAGPGAGAGAGQSPVTGGRAARRRARRPPPPLAQRDGLDAAHWRIPPRAPAAPGESRGELTVLEALLSRFPALGAPEATPLPLRFARGEIVRADGTAWSAQDPARAGQEVWFHRELRPEVVPEREIPILFRDEHLLVIDKPHDMATLPRGAHVLGSALVRLRRATGITELSPLHRLDRRTAGVLAFGIRSAERAAYQQLFARTEVAKEYLARVRILPGASESEPPLHPGAAFSMRDRLVKEHGELQGRVIAGEPNAHTEVEVLEVSPAAGELEALTAARTPAPRTALLRLQPRTGRTHQLRLQLASRGLPICGDDLYPEARAVGPEDPPLALLARRLAFTDPFTGEEREFLSARSLAEGADGPGRPGPGVSTLEP